MIGDILQPTHLLFILVIALLVLGPKRLPEVGRALGRGLRDFRNALNTDDLRDQMISPPTTHTDTPTSQEQARAAETPVANESPDVPTVTGDHATGAPEPGPDPAGVPSTEPSTDPREPAASAPASDRPS